MRFIGARLCSTLWTVPARAELSELRIAQQTSVAFPQFNVMKHRQLVEKHAVAPGVPDLKVTFATFNGPDGMNDALLSGAVDVASGVIMANKPEAVGYFVEDTKTRINPDEVMAIVSGRVVWRDAVGFDEVRGFPLPPRA